MRAFLVEHGVKGHHIRDNEDEFGPSSDSRLLVSDRVASYREYPAKLLV